MAIPPMRRQTGDQAKVLVVAPLMPDDAVVPPTVYIRLDVKLSLADAALLLVNEPWWCP